MVRDLVHNLCGSLVENIGGVAGVGKKTPPTPITYLTQWKIVGNSQVHTDPYLTSWKVSGNSVVDNNTILSCGDLGQDGMYHIKISNGVTIYDIPLTEPLRKVNNVADTIEFPSETEGKALVTRNIKKIVIDPNKITAFDFGSYRLAVVSDATSGDENTIRTLNNLYGDVSLKNRGASNVAPPRIYMQSNVVLIRGTEVQQQGGDVSAYKQELTDFYANGGTFDVLYALATPTTELVDVSQFPVSPTDTYTSANVTPYSAFEHTENKEIWSCGEYNATDGKYHILVKPQGGSIADIAIDEPLRKVNDVADSIEFVNGVATLTRNLIRIGSLGTLNTWTALSTGVTGKVRWRATDYASQLKPTSNISSIPNTLCSMYPTITTNVTYDWGSNKGINISTAGNILIIDEDYSASEDYNNFIEHLNGVELIGELATPITKTIEVPQIEEAESYTMVISQGGKAVSWSSFTWG